MSKQGYRAEQLDRVVSLYQRFREDGETVDEAWKWAAMIVRAVENFRAREQFEAEVMADIDSLDVLTLNRAI